jgi:hypothetical protein
MSDAGSQHCASACGLDGLAPDACKVLSRVEARGW